MPRQIAPLHPDTHADTKVAARPDYAPARDQQAIPLVVHEFAGAACDLPIVFIKNSETGQFQPVALVGFKAGENLYMDGDQWTGLYVPRIMLQHPFGFMANEDNAEQLMVVLDEASPVVGAADGEALFNGREESDFLKARTRAVAEYLEHSQITGGFSQMLADLDLLAPRNLSLEVAGEKIGVNGIYCVDEEKLRTLADATYLDLRNRGFIAVIHAHLVSLGQLHRLAKRRAEKRQAAA